jgi:N-acyl-D-amino-acid deacylase
MFDLVVIGGHVYDGTGSAPVETDVGVLGDRIRDVGDLSGAECDTTIHAKGRAVCPGFIDAHSHSDTYVLIEPSAESKVFQGITTEIVGNCGVSAAPRVGEYRMPSDWADKEYPGEWTSVAEYRELLEQVRPAVNIALLVGHSALRAGVMGYGDRAAGEEDLDGMGRLLDEALEQGARGLSTGLIYAPGMFASTEEIIRLSAIIAKYDGIYTSHMRSEGRNLPAAIEEALRIGREAGVRVEVSHLKTAGRQNWGLLDEALNLLRGARARGEQVAADRYPYLCSCTELDVIFPDWAAQGGRDAALSRVRDKADRAAIREHLLQSRGEQYWSTIVVGSTSHPDNRKYRGKPLPDIAADLGMDSVDTVLHLVDTDELKTTAFFFGMSEENMWRIYEEPYVMVGTDASLRATRGVLSEDYPHPRAYGSFTRFLRACLDGKTVSPAEGIRKMTSLPAEHFHLKSRGTIRKGSIADIVVFDPVALRDRSSWEQPHVLSEGVEHVIVNGIPVVADGAMTGDRPGVFL